ncbi:hypothetical protein SAMN05216475_2892 [Pseudomonas synxantha]|nr:hypothetical protein SAMN05216475_2892 [Pseudomonas synxantha]
MARGGGPPNPCRITGTPSLSEVPSGGARAFGYFALFKVTRCKSGTLSGRYRSNGYVLALIRHAGRLSGRHRGQAPSHTWAETISQILVGCQAAIGGKPPPTLGPRPSVKYWSAVRPPSGASPLPHLGRDHQSNTGRLSGRHRGKPPPTLGPRPSVKYWSAVRPPSGASPLPHLGRDHQSNTGRLSGRHRGQAPSHTWAETISQILVGCQAAIGGKPLPHLGRDHQSNTGRLSGRHREQAPSHTWAETISQILVGCQAAIGGKPLPHLGRDHQSNTGRLSGRHRGASPLPHLGRDHQSNTGRLSGRHRGQAPSHTWTETISQILVGCQAAIGGKPPPTLGPRPSVKYWSAVRPPSGASRIVAPPLPHLDRGASVRSL